jgi:ketosteroid isomerase-like protein
VAAPSPNSPLGDLVAATGSRDPSAALQTEESHVWTLRDGRIVRMQMFLDRGEALAAAGLTPDS